MKLDELLGNKEVLDLQAATDHVLASGLADPNRLGVGATVRIESALGLQPCVLVQSLIAG